MNSAADTACAPIASAASLESSHPTATERFFSAFIKALILYSVAMYFIETEVVRSLNSRAGPPFFLWSERIVASIFTIEYFVRWYRSRSARYPFTPTALLDLIVILPFWIGFLVEPTWLAWVRSLRILRLLRFFYHDAEMHRYLCIMARAWPYARSAVKVLCVLLLTYVAAIYQMEHTVQPERLSCLRDTFYFAVMTISTVGFGDICPVTMGGKILTILFVLIGGIVLTSLFAVVTTTFVNEMLTMRHERRP